MPADLKRYVDKINALSMRERVLIFVALLVILSQLWDSLLWQPVVTQQDQLLAQETAINKEMLQMQIDLKILTARASQDPDQAVKQQIARLEQQLDAVNGNIRQASRALIEPAQMARLLESMLLEQKELQLLSLQTLDAQPMIKIDNEDTRPLKYQVFRHGFSIEFRGGYMATLRYLEALEQLDEQFFWESVDYRVEDYPDGRVRLELYTLSLSEGWIGV